MKLCPNKGDDQKNVNTMYISSYLENLDVLDDELLHLCAKAAFSVSYPEDYSYYIEKGKIKIMQLKKKNLSIINIYNKLNFFLFLN